MLDTAICSSQEEVEEIFISRHVMSRPVGIGFDRLKLKVVAYFITCL
jgi:hypothetical protein